MTVALLDVLFLQPLIAYCAALFGLLDPLPVGWRLIVFGIVLNLLLMPIYFKMERGQRAHRERAANVAQDVARMHRHFRGRERFFYVRAVHRQHGYHPLSALAGSTDLLVQIVVFAIVYRFLSAHDALAGATFGPVADLAQPDALLGGANLLPLLMTAINAIAVWRYSQDVGRRAQGLALAALFLILLYASPSGLVLYWTSNNLFALLRNTLQPRIGAWLTPRWQRHADFAHQR